MWMCNKVNWLWYQLNLKLKLQMIVKKKKNKIKCCFLICVRQACGCECPCFACFTVCCLRVWAYMHLWVCMCACSKPNSHRLIINSCTEMPYAIPWVCGSDFGFSYFSRSSQWYSSRYLSLLSFHSFFIEFSSLSAWNVRVLFT